MTIETGIPLSIYQSNLGNINAVVPDVWRIILSYILGSHDLKRIASASVSCKFFYNFIVDQCVSFQRLKAVLHAPSNLNGARMEDKESGNDLGRNYQFMASDGERRNYYYYRHSSTLEYHFVEVSFTNKTKTFSSLVVPLQNSRYEDILDCHPTEDGFAVVTDKTLYWMKYKEEKSLNIWTCKYASVYPSYLNSCYQNGILFIQSRDVNMTEVMAFVFGQKANLLVDLFKLNKDSRLVSSGGHLFLESVQNGHAYLTECQYNNGIELKGTSSLPLVQNQKYIPGGENWILSEGANKFLRVFNIQTHAPWIDEKNKLLIPPSDEGMISLTQDFLIIIRFYNLKKLFHVIYLPTKTDLSSEIEQLLKKNRQDHPDEHLITFAISRDENANFSLTAYLSSDTQDNRKTIQLSFPIGNLKMQAGQEKKKTPIKKTDLRLTKINPRAGEWKIYAIAMLGIACWTIATFLSVRHFFSGRVFLRTAGIELTLAELTLLSGGGALTLSLLAIGSYRRFKKQTSNIIQNYG